VSTQQLSLDQDCGPAIACGWRGTSYAKDPLSAERQPLLEGGRGLDLRLPFVGAGTMQVTKDVLAWRWRKLRPFLFLGSGLPPCLGQKSRPRWRRADQRDVAGVCSLAERAANPLARFSPWPNRARRRGSAKLRSVTADIAQITDSCASPGSVSASEQGSGLVSAEVRL